VILELAGRRQSLKGLQIVWEPKALRHFTAKFEPL
jgi:tryptophanase